MLHIVAEVLFSFNFDVEAAAETPEPPAEEKAPEEQPPVAEAATEE